MSESWQIACPRCRWQNSGANAKCAKCGQPLRRAPGMLVAGERSGRPKPVVTPKVVQPGGLLPRLIALIIDGLILFVLSLGINALWKAQLRPVVVTPGTDFTVQAFQQRLVLIGALLVLNLFYLVGSWNLLGGTPGMLILNLRVVDKSGTTLSFGRSLMRWIWYELFGVLAPVSAILVAIGKEKRALHDIMAGTYVIQYLDADKVAASIPPDPAAAVVVAPTAVRPGTPALPVTNYAPPPPAPGAPAVTPVAAPYTPPSSTSLPGAAPYAPPPPLPAPVALPEPLPLPVAQAAPELPPPPAAVPAEPPPAPPIQPAPAAAAPPLSPAPGQALDFLPPPAPGAGPGPGHYVDRPGLAPLDPYPVPFIPAILPPEGNSRPEPELPAPPAPAPQPDALPEPGASG